MYYPLYLYYEYWISNNNGKGLIIKNSIRQMAETHHEWRQPTMTRVNMDYYKKKPLKMRANCNETLYSNIITLRNSFAAR